MFNSKMYSSCIVLLCMINFIQTSLAVVIPTNSLSKRAASTGNATSQNSISSSSDVSCTCGVFLTGQFVKGSSKPPTGNAAITIEPEETFPCNSAGVKKCTTKCLESLVQHLSTSSGIICGSVDRDVFRERVYLFVKNCNSDWINTRMSAGREYCCKNYEYYLCPNLST